MDHLKILYKRLKECADSLHTWQCGTWDNTHDLEMAGSEGRRELVVTARSCSQPKKIRFCALLRL